MDDRDISFDETMSSDLPLLAAPRGGLGLRREVELRALAFDRPLGGLLIDLSSSSSCTSLLSATIVSFGFSIGVMRSLEVPETS